MKNHGRIPRQVAAGKRPTSDESLPDGSQRFMVVCIASAICWFAASLGPLGQAMAQPEPGAASSGQALWVQPGVPTDVETPVVPGATRATQATGAIGPVTGHVVRVAYIIPTNRTAQA